VIVAHFCAKGREIWVVVLPMPMRLQCGNVERGIAAAIAGKSAASFAMSRS